MPETILRNAVVTTMTCFQISSICRQCAKNQCAVFWPDNQELEPFIMARLGIKDAFARYGAVLHNVQWSVSAWAADGSLVVSLWDHHYRKGLPGTLEFADSVNRWQGPGNTEFRKHREGLRSRFRRQTRDRAHGRARRVEAGEDLSKLKKNYSVRNDVIGKVVEWGMWGDYYVVRFTKK